MTQPRRARSSSPLAPLRRAAAVLLPDGIRRFARRYRQLGRDARAIFVAETIQRLTRRREEPSAVLPPLSHGGSVLFVCHGNILRSAFAAAYCRRLAAESGSGSVSLTSAGLHARGGRPADTRGIDAARQLGVDLGDHRARQLTADLVREADIVVVMDFANEAECLATFPGIRPKLRFLGAFDPREHRPSVEIPDPYTQGADGVRRSYEDIAACTRELWSMLHLMLGVMSRDQATGVASPFTLPPLKDDRPANAAASRGYGR